MKLQVKLNKPRRFNLLYSTASPYKAQVVKSAKTYSRKPKHRKLND